MSANRMFNRFVEYPQHAEAITANDTTDLSRPMIIYIEGGVVVVHDLNGTSHTFTVPAATNFIIPILCQRVLATGTTATVIKGLY